MAVADIYADDYIRLPGFGCQKRDESRQPHHEIRRALFASEPVKPLRNRGIKPPEHEPLRRICILNWFTFFERQNGWMRVVGKQVLPPLNLFTVGRSCGVQDAPFPSRIVTVLQRLKLR